MPSTSACRMREFSQIFAGRADEEDWFRLNYTNIRILVQEGYLVYERLVRFSEALALEDLCHVLPVNEHVGDEAVVHIATVRDDFHRSTAEQFF